MTWATVAELRSQINKTSNLIDIDLTLILTAAENTINRFCRRTEGFLADSVASAHLYIGSGHSHLYIDECVEITAVGVKESVTDTTFTSWAATDWLGFRGDYKDPNFNATPYTGIMVNPSGDYSYFYNSSGMRAFRSDWDDGVRGGAPTIQVTAKWGAFVTIPAELKEASIMQAARWFKRLEGAMADALASGDFGMMMYRQSLDPDIAMILRGGRFVKPTVGRR